ncbi:MAG: hypothetical protein AAGK32_15905 [Actinomycetota bacterium]
MLIQKILGGVLFLAGAVCLGIGLTSDSSDGLVMVGAILLFIGAMFVVVNALISPLMKSSREIAEASGMEVSKLTGAPKMGAAMEQGRQQMAQARDAMAGLTGDAAARANGQSGTAVVTTAQDTGRVSNLNPVYSVGLTVTPEAGAPYDVVVDTEVNTLAVAKAVPGTRVPVIIDLTDPSNVRVDWISVI